MTAFYTAFTTPPVTQDGHWLHESLWHSIQIIFWGFLISSIIGVPLGILCGTYAALSRLSEPFIEFFRYLPAPAFGALAVAILGIYDGPKIAIIVIGTLFQQVLIIANTTRKLDVALVEAALTLGAKRAGKLLGRVVIPGILPDLYRDQRILLGWAWTYLIVAELIGTSSGITWFITQQARYQHFANVYAAIMIIGIIGLGTDMLLALARPAPVPVGSRRWSSRHEAMNQLVMPRPLPSYLDQSPDGARALRAPQGARRHPRSANISARSSPRSAGATRRAERHQLRHPSARIPLRDRPVRLRQVDPGPHPRRARGAELGRGAARRQAGHRARQRPRHGVPGLHAVPLADGEEERDVRPGGQRPRPATRPSARRCSGWSWSASRNSPTPIRTSFPAA